MYQIRHHSIHFSCRPLECPQFRRFPPSPKSPTWKETKTIKNLPKVRRDKNPYNLNIQCSAIELLRGRYHSGLQGSLNIENFHEKPLAVILLLSLLLFIMEKCANFRRILAWEFVFQIDAVIQAHNNLPLFETLDPNYSSETCPTQFHGRLTKENKSHFVPIELVKKMLRSPNFTQSCLPSRTIFSPIFSYIFSSPFMHIQKMKIVQNVKTKLTKPRIPNQTNNPTKPIQTYRTKPTKPNLGGQTYQIKPTRPNLPHQT